MTHDPQMLELVFGCVDQLNQQLPAAERLPRSADTVFAGPGSTLDSLSIITMLVELERVAGERGITMSLLDHPELGNETGPFRTLGSLAGLVGGAR